MKFIEGLCEAVTRALGLSALSPWEHSQQPVGPSHVDEAHHALQTLFPADRLPANLQAEGVALPYEKLPGGQTPPIPLAPGPKFGPPNASPGFSCDYSAMKGWKHTAGNLDRNSWLEKPIGDDDSSGGIYNIFTNYDRFVPIGSTRKVRGVLPSCSGSSRLLPSSG